MREYERTHKWLTFEVHQQIQRMQPRLWMALGEAQSKCEHLAGTPMMKGTADTMLGIYLAKGVAATTAIEGNTLSEEEVQQRIEGKLRLPKSQEYLGKEIDNVIKACNQVLANLRKSERLPITEDFIKEMNRAMLDGIAHDSDVIPGEYTKVQIGVLRYRAAPPNEVPYLMAKYCEWMNSDDFKAPQGDEIVYGILKAIIAHIYFVWIHPFGDGNGRTARMLEVRFLLEAGVPNVAAHLLSNHYNKTRTAYYQQLDKASRSGGDIVGFIQYAVTGLVDLLRGQIEYIKSQQMKVAWQNYVYKTLSRTKGESGARRREIVFALTNLDLPVKRSDIRTLNPKLTSEFSNRGERTLSRDLNALVSAKLIESVQGGYVANQSMMLAFLPIRLRGSRNQPEPKPIEAQEQQMEIPRSILEAAGGGVRNSILV